MKELNWSKMDEIHTYIFIKDQIEDIKERVDNIDDYCKEKEYYNGQRQAKIDQIIDKIDYLDESQKEALKKLLNDSETLENNLKEKLKQHDAIKDELKDEINHLKIDVAELPLKVSKYTAAILTVFIITFNIINHIPALINLLT